MELLAGLDSFLSVSGTFFSFLVQETGNHVSANAPSIFAFEDETKNVEVKGMLFREFKLT